MTKADEFRAFSIKISAEADAQMKMVKAELGITQNRLIDLALRYIDWKKLKPIIAEEDEEQARADKLEEAKSAIKGLTLAEITELYKEANAKKKSR